MKISILIPTLGERPKEIDRLLKSITLQSYKSIEVIIISQSNFDDTESIVEKYRGKLEIVHLYSVFKGISRARNEGLKKVSGDLVVLSDDDCWYPENSMYNICNTFRSSSIDIDILLTKIFDPIEGEDYKKYPDENTIITKRRELLSKSSIEIAFRNNQRNVVFDEKLGLGAAYVCGEETDYLIRRIKQRDVIYYNPIITVYHRKKNCKSTEGQIIAKGYLYGKYFGFVFSFLVCCRDLLLKKENNFKNFFKGYIQGAKMKKERNGSN